MPNPRRLNALLVLSVAIFCAGWFGATYAQTPTRRYVNPQSPADNGRPFSGAVQVGDTLYLSGTLGLGPKQQVPATVEEEARNVLNGIRDLLKGAGMTMDDLVSVQVFCSDVAHYAAFNTVYRTYFTREFPARAFLGSGALLNGARFEVMGVAVKR
jgi:2-iminobutanoate/2-iminopropanoate deaminase